MVTNNTKQAVYSQEGGGKLSAPRLLVESQPVCLHTAASYCRFRMMPAWESLNISLAHIRVGEGPARRDGCTH